MIMPQSFQKIKFVALMYYNNMISLHYFIAKKHEFVKRHIVFQNRKIIRQTVIQQNIEW